MGYALIVFSSSTTASRLKRMAFRDGIKDVGMIQTPKIISVNGCTYSVRARVSDLEQLRQTAEEYGLKYIRIYREIIGTDGQKSYEQIM